MKLQDFNYKGKKVFLGIDVHKKKYVIAATCDAVIAKKWVANSSSMELTDQIKRYFKGAEIFSAYEADPCKYSKLIFLMLRLRKGVLEPVL